MSKRGLIMTDKIQMTRDDAILLLRVFGLPKEYDAQNIEILINNGYIKKSVVEKAEELYYQYKLPVTGASYDVGYVIEVLYKAIQYLKEQVKK
jgi:hypothetical protein